MSYMIDWRQQCLIPKVIWNQLTATIGHCSTGMIYGFSFSILANSTTIFMFLWSMPLFEIVI